MFSVMDYQIQANFKSLQVIFNDNIMKANYLVAYKDEKVANNVKECMICSNSNFNFHSSDFTEMSNYINT